MLVPNRTLRLNLFLFLGPLGFFNVHQALFERHWIDVAVEFRMRQRLVEIEELDALGRIISINRLQPGDVTDERRSSQTTVDDDGVLALEALGIELLAAGVVDIDLGEPIARPERHRPPILRDSRRDRQQESQRQSNEVKAFHFSNHPYQY